MYVKPGVIHSNGPPSVINVILIYPFDPLGSKIGGVETFIKGFVKHAPADFDLEFVGLTSNRQSRPKLHAMDIRLDGRRVRFLPLITMRDENRRSRFPVSLRFTLALTIHRVRRPGAILLFNRIEPLLAFRNDPCPKIGFVHNDIPRQCAGEGGEVLWSRFPRMYRRIERRTFKSLDAVFTSSRSTLDLFRDRYRGTNSMITFLPAWIDPDVFGPSAGGRRRDREALAATFPALPVQEPWILFAGRLQTVKDPLLALAGFDRFRAAHGPGAIVFVGAGNMAGQLLREIRLRGLEGRAFLLGEKRQAELASFYRAADVFLMTSRYEAGPRCVLEALGSGTPVVATDVGEVRSIVRSGETGEIVTIRSSDEIASALMRILKREVPYDPAACARSVADYRPEIVLAPVYARIRELARLSRLSPEADGLGKTREHER